MPDDHGFAEDRSVRDTIRQLFDAGKELADAELAWAKARGACLASALMWIAVWGAGAFFLAFGLVVTVMVGGVLALAPHFGLGLALLSVCAAGGLTILLCVLAIKFHVRRITRLAE